MSTTHFAGIFALALLGGWLSPFAPTTRAEMPPSAYRSLQHRAAEALEVKITSVQTEKSETKNTVVTRVTAEAQVLTVTRTATQLKAGATIVIAYDHQTPKTPGWVGPSAVPILRKGEKCPAYLRRISNKPPVYEAAAGGYTFRSIGK